MFRWVLGEEERISWSTARPVPPVAPKMAIEGVFGNVAVDIIGEWNDRILINMN